MKVWFRVFAATDGQVEPAALLEQGSKPGKEITGRFRGDDQGWFEARLAFAPEEPFVPFLEIVHFLHDEEGIRQELNTWAAWLETKEKYPEHVRLMQQVIGTRQLFIGRSAGEDGSEAVMRVCWKLQQYLARETQGIYQVDGRGFFAGDGTLLIPE
jgi:hypothetical protein